MDRGVNHLYGEGLKAYDKKNEWEAQISYLKNRMISRLQYMMEKFDTPEEGWEEPVVQERQEENPLEEKSTELGLIPV